VQECGVIGPLHEFGVEETRLAVSLGVWKEGDLREPPAPRKMEVDLLGRREEKVLPLVRFHAHSRVDSRAELRGEGLCLLSLLRGLLGLPPDSPDREKKGGRVPERP